MPTNKNSKILTVGWDHRIIKEIFPVVENKGNHTFSHFLYSQDFNFLKNHKSNFELYEAGSNQNKISSSKKLEFLAKIEENSNVTINTIILSDRVLKLRKTSKAYMYLSNLADELYKAIKTTSPLYILGSWDGAIQGIGMLVARYLNIPFIIPKFSVIPHKYMTFCTYPNNYDELKFTANDYDETYKLAKESRDNWIEGLVEVPAYVSAKTTLDIFKRIPVHIKEVYMKKLANIKYGRNDFIYFSFYDLLNQYIRKKLNIFSLNKNMFITKVPDYKYVFYGLHMQPESTVDVMAPFYSNQLELIKNISRSVPVDLKILVKIHVSDADNYSKKELEEYLNIPNVILVSPFVSSKEFIVNSKLLFSIQGTIGLEGGLIGKPVIMFGNSSYLKFSTIEKSNKIEDLPFLVSKQLNREKPSEKQILKDYTNLLINYLPSCDDDWSITLKKGFSNQEKQNWINMFNQITDYIELGRFTYTNDLR